MKKRLILILLAISMLSGCSKTVVAHTLRSDIEYIPPETEEVTTQPVSEETEITVETEITTETEETEISEEIVLESTTVTDETTLPPETEALTEETAETPVIVTAATTTSVPVVQSTTVSSEEPVTSATTEKTTVSTTKAATAATEEITTSSNTKPTTTTVKTSVTTILTTTSATTTTATTTTSAVVEEEDWEEEEEEEEEWEPEYDYSPVEVATEALKHNATADSFIKSVNGFLTKAKSGGYGMINGEEGSIVYIYVEDGLWMVSVDNTDCFKYKEEVMEWSGYGEADKNTSTSDAEDPDTLFAIYMAKEFPNIYNASAGVWVEDGKCKAAYFTDDTTSGDSQMEFLLGEGGWTESSCEWDGYNQGMSEDGNVVGTSPVLKFKVSE